jgi:hypothetical protein
MSGSTVTLIRSLEDSLTHALTLVARARPPDQDGPMSSDPSRTRRGLHQLAVHVLARRRSAVTGRFGLRPAPGGLATPAFGGPDDLEVVRTSGRFLVLERGGAVTVRPITTLAAAAELVGVDLGADLSVGTDTPAAVPVDEPLGVDDADARLLAAWWALGRTVIDEVLATEPSPVAPSVAQVWPEHFDLGCAVGPDDARINLGASPGDGYEPTPYLYLGPWTADRPGDPQYWNAPFGAVLRLSQIDHLTPAERAARAMAFFQDGLLRF